MICKICGLDDTIPRISFINGECNFCQWHRQWEKEHTEKKLLQIARYIKQANRKNQYDVIVGVSGGKDSSYLLSQTVELGLRPLAVHWNNHWNTETANTNMQRITEALNVDFIQATCNREEYDNICKSFLLASVPDADIPNDIALTRILYNFADIPNDIALTRILYNFAEQYKLPVFEGHDFRVEGTTPIGWSYMDGMYIQSVHKQFGSIPLKTFPNLLISDWFRYLALEIKRYRPLWHLPSHPDSTRDLLKSNFQWQDYNMKHTENKYTTFISNYLQPRKFHIDLRRIFLAAQVRSKYKSLREAKETLAQPTEVSDQIILEVEERLGLSLENGIMKTPCKTHRDYTTYERKFEASAKFFKMLAPDLVPKTFLAKYT